MAACVERRLYQAAASSGYFKSLKRLFSKDFIPEFYRALPLSQSTLHYLCLEGFDGINDLAIRFGKGELLKF